jgi:hypothetical protein
MASNLQTVVGPRFLLPKISQRLTPVRPTNIAALANTSKRAHEIKTKRSISSAIRTKNARSPFHVHPSFTRPSTHQGKNTNGSQDRSPTVARRSFSSTAVRARDHHFDTLKFVQRLKDEGFTEEQAVAMMKVLSDVIEERQVYMHSPTPRILI